MNLLLVGISHKTASVEVRERFFPEAERDRLFAALIK